MRLNNSRIYFGGRMFTRKNAQKKECSVCGRILQPSQFNETNCQFFIDGRLPICKECLSKPAETDNNTTWDYVNSVCQWTDVEFIPEKWVSMYTINPKGALGRYLDLYSLKNKQTTTWSKKEAYWREILAKQQDGEILEIFSEDKRKQLQEKWGSYTDTEIQRAEKLYDGLNVAFGLNSSQAEDHALKLCRISIEIDRAIEAGLPIDKLITSYNNLQKIAGFTTDNARDLNNFESISELFMYIAKQGWEKKYHNDETNDIVDTTIKDMQSYNRRLYKNETSIAEQIQDKVQIKKRIEEMELQANSFDEMELDNWEDAAFAKVNNDDDVIEEFEVN